jgi:hypothetical protein
MSSAPEILLTLHGHHHDRLREHLFRMLEALVAVDVAVAAAHLATFVRELDEGLALEDEIVMPAYRALGPVSGPGRSDHVEGDHVILRRGVGFVEAFVDDVRQAPSLRVVLEGLPHVYRLLGTLEHHTEREQRHVYPAVIPTLAPGPAARLAAGLGRLVEPGGVP